MGHYRSSPHQRVLADRDPSENDRTGANPSAALETRRHQLGLADRIVPDQLTVVDRADACAQEHPIGQHA